MEIAGGHWLAESARTWPKILTWLDPSSPSSKGSRTMLKSPDSLGWSAGDCLLLKQPRQMKSSTRSAGRCTKMIGAFEEKFIASGCSPDKASSLAWMAIQPLKEPSFSAALSIAANPIAGRQRVGSCHKIRGRKRVRIREPNIPIDRRKNEDNNFWRHRKDRRLTCP